MTPVPVLFLDHASALGGAEYSLLSILRHLDRAKWQPHLGGVPGPLIEQARAEGVLIHEVGFPRLRGFPRRAPGGLGAAWRIARIARQTGTALIYSNTVRAAFYAAAAARLARRPFVWHMRDCWLSASTPRRLWVDRGLKGLLCTAATRVIANSHATALHLPRAGNRGPEIGDPGSAASLPERFSKITVIHNSIETEHFDPSLDGTLFRTLRGIPADAPLVGMVGRLLPLKGQRRFIEAMARVAASEPEARFLVVGGAIFDADDGYETSLHQLTADLGLQHRITFTGHLPDVTAALASMDVFVHPGDPEGFGRVNLEAMAMAKPVVALAHGALPEIVVDGETGLLVQPREPNGLARGVITLLQSPEHGKKLGAAGRARVIARFSLRDMVQQIDRVLTGLL